MLQKKKIKKQRLDKIILDKKLAKNLKEAQAFIMAGKILVNNQACYQSGILTKENALIKVKPTNPYVSIGGLKLHLAFKFLGINNLNGFTCLDVGASTGGFTDCMLKYGAVKIYAIDVGSKQLHYKLRKDNRVINIENMNFRYFDKFNFRINKIDLITVDVSFISLSKIIPVLYNTASKKSLVLVMIKPQFELQPYELIKGIVKNKVLRQKAINKIKNIAINIGFIVKSEVCSAIKGRKGNLEHFLLLEK